MANDAFRLDLSSSKKSVTKLRDIFALVWWANVTSPWNWAGGVIAAVVFESFGLDLRFDAGIEALMQDVFTFVVVFPVIFAGIWLVSSVLMLVNVGVDVLRGVLGPKTFTISADTLAEHDGNRTTSVSWRQVRSIDKTRRHIFIRISRWKYMLLAARDFENEQQFAQYYADLVRARFDNT